MSVHAWEWERVKKSLSSWDIFKKLLILAGYYDLPRISNDINIPLQSLGEVYLICLYFVCTVFTTVGFGAQTFPNIFQERLIEANVSNPVCDTIKDDHTQIVQEQTIAKHTASGQVCKTKTPEPCRWLERYSVIFDRGNVTKSWCRQKTKIPAHSPHRADADCCKDIEKWMSDSKKWRIRIFSIWKAYVIVGTGDVSANNTTERVRAWARSFFLLACTFRMYRCSPTFEYACTRRPSASFWCVQQRAYSGSSWDR